MGHTSSTASGHDLGRRRSPTLTCGYESGTLVSFGTSSQSRRLGRRSSFSSVTDRPVDSPEEVDLMKLLRRLHPSPALVVACIALALSLGGVSYAALRLPANSVGTRQVINGSLLKGDFKAWQLP